MVGSDVRLSVVHPELSRAEHAAEFSTDYTGSALKERYWSDYSK